MGRTVSCRTAGRSGLSTPMPRGFARRLKTAFPRRRPGRTRVLDTDLATTHQWRTRRPQTQAHPICQEPTCCPRYDLGSIGRRRAVNSRGAGSISRWVLTDHTVGTSHGSRQHRRRGGEDRVEGSSLSRVSNRRYCQYPNLAAGFRRRALFRGAFVANQERLGRLWPHAVSVRGHRHASIVPGSDRIQPANLGEKRLPHATVPTGLADSCGPTVGFGFRTRMEVVRPQGSHGRHGLGFGRRILLAEGLANAT